MDLVVDVNVIASSLLSLMDLSDKSNELELP